MKRLASLTALVVGLWAIGQAPVALTPRLRAQNPQPVSGTLPLSMVFFDLGVGDKSQVQTIATMQAANQPLYKSSQLESLIFEGEFIPAQPKTGESVVFSVFSDDGVDVEVDNKVIFKRFGKGQHLPNLKESLHDVPGPDEGKWIPGKRYFVRVKYSNIIFTGDADIDGLTVFAHNGGGQVPTVEFVNETRGGDRVVSAKDEPKEMPGGKKELVVKIKNSKAKATLKIVGKDKNAGSASFDPKGEKAESKGASDGDSIQIFGRRISSAPRDVAIQAFLDDKLAGQWDFTVFRVDLSFLGSGSEITDKAVSDEGLALRDLAKDITGSTKAGLFIKEMAGGSELTTGKIVPSGMNKDDFFQKGKAGYKSGNGFFFQRRFSARTYIDDCFHSALTPQGLPLNSNDSNDSFDDKMMKVTHSLDLSPGNDKAGNDLFIHSFDAPSVPIARLLLPVKSSHRARYNFQEYALYDDVRCSALLKWHLAQSFVRKSYTPAGLNEDPKDYARDDAVQGDNRIAEGEISLTKDLAKGAAPLPNPEYHPLSPIAAQQASLAGNRMFARSDKLTSFYAMAGIYSKGAQNAKLTVSFKELSGKGPALISMNEKAVDEEELVGTLQFANRNSPGVYIPVVTIGKTCSVPFGAALYLQGPPVKWQLDPLVVFQGKILGSVAAIDDQMLGVSPPPPAPKVTRTGGNVEFNIGPLMAAGPTYLFEIMVTKAPAKGPFTFELRAEGGGLTPATLKDEQESLK